MALITYEDKETLIDNPVLEKYKCTAENLNEIKAGINTNNDKLVGNEPMGSIVVDSIRSKNMLNLLNFVSLTANGVTFTNNGNGSITINGTATQDFGVNFALFKIKAGNYYLSINESSTLPNVFYLYDHDSNVGFGNGAITLSQDYNKMGFDTWITNGTSFNNITISPQLETGSTATTYAPYQNLTGQEFYSTGEIVIGTWIDGKTLYRRVVVKDNIGTGGNAGYAYAYIDTLTKMQFIAVTSGVGIIDGNFNDGTNKVTLQAYKNSSDIDIWFNSTVSCTKLIITLEYTKTTD